VLGEDVDVVDPADVVVVAGTVVDVVVETGAEAVVGEIEPVGAGRLEGSPVLTACTSAMRPLTT
jgi:putative intracellular protease/amidase